MSSISIAIPVHNAMPFIREALSSVRNQSKQPTEIVVVENKSNDGTAQFLRTQNDIRLVQQLSLESAPRNWSRAVAETTGDYVKVLCADDVLDSVILERQVSVLEQHPDVAMVVSARRVITPNGRVLIPRLGLRGNSRRIKSSEALRIMALHGGNPFGEVGSVLFRGSVLRSCLPWPSNYGYTTDLAMYALILASSDLYSLDEVHSSFRIGHDSWSHDVRRSQHSDQRLFIDAIDRRYNLNLSQAERSVALFRARLRQAIRQVLSALARLFDRVSKK